MYRSQEEQNTGQTYITHAKKKNLVKKIALLFFY